jgi:hypothetical protein
VPKAEAKNRINTKVDKGIDSANKSNLVSLPSPGSQQRARSDRSSYDLLAELTHEVRELNRKTQPAAAIRTEIPLTKKEAAAELGLKLKEFNIMIENRQLVDGTHLIEMGDSIILVKNILEILFEDRRKAAEYAMKPTQEPPPTKRACGERKRYKRKS